MNVLSRVENKIKYLYKRYIKRDAFLSEVNRWFRDKGDQTLRLNYPLNSESVVFDVGGYHGDFADEIYQKHGCRIYIFEPVPEYYSICVERFDGNPDIICLNYGLSSANGFLDIGLSENASSVVSPDVQSELLQVEIRAVTDCINELNITRIDLFKINIEGGEFDVLPLLIESEEIKKVRCLQVQFHNFIDHAQEKRANICQLLKLTHSEMWSYEFVWESWELNDN